MLIASGQIHHRVVKESWHCHWGQGPEKLARVQLLRFRRAGAHGIDPDIWSRCDPEMEKCILCCLSLKTLFEHCGVIPSLALINVHRTACLYFQPLAQG